MTNIICDLDVFAIPCCLLLIVSIFDIDINISTNLGSPTTTWHYVLTLINQGTQPVTVRYVKHNENIVKELGPYAQFIDPWQVIQPTRPEPLQITAYDSVTNNPVLVNGVMSYSVEATASTVPMNIIIGMCTYSSVLIIFLSITNQNANPF